MDDLLDEIEGVAAGRRLQARRLTASAPFWGCDDTLFECKPICMKKMGVATTKVADSLCSAAPMDQCACKCFHEAQWTCEVPSDARTSLGLKIGSTSTFLLNAFASGPFSAVSMPISASKH